MVELQPSILYTSPSHPIAVTVVEEDGVLVSVPGGIRAKPAVPAHRHAGGLSCV